MSTEKNNHNAGHEAFSALFRGEESPEYTTSDPAVEQDNQQAVESQNKKESGEVFTKPNTDAMFEEPNIDAFEEEPKKRSIRQRQPFWAWFWDQLPLWTRQNLKDLGFSEPLGIIKTAPINSAAGKKGGLLIGPPKAGKTTLIAAINRACLIPVRSEIDLRWKGGVDEASQYELNNRLNEALNQILSGSQQSFEDRQGISATWRVVKYAFNIEGRLRHPTLFNSTKLFDMVLSFRDGPGGAMFSDDDNTWNSQADNRKNMIMVEDSQNAYTLIFCLDGSKKNAYFIQSQLARILPVIQDHKDNNGYIPQQKVMILLNKIDYLAATLYEQLNQKYDNLDITPKTIAEEMDPLQMAFECLGYPAIKMIRDSMHDDAELAIALVSTWGFKDSGSPLVDKNGRPIFASEFSRGDANDFIAQWHPFGVRESLIYLATGRTAPMIHIVTPDDLNQEQSEPIRKNL